MEQTAVNWLFEQVNNLDWRNLQGEKKLEIFEQAKAMEQDAIIQAYSNGWHDGQDVILSQVKHIDIGGDKAGEHYFNDTFKTEDNGQ